MSEVSAASPTPSRIDVLAHLERGTLRCADEGGAQERAWHGRFEPHETSRVGLGESPAPGYSPVSRSGWSSDKEGLATDDHTGREGLPRMIIGADLSACADATRGTPRRSNPACREIRVLIDQSAAVLLSMDRAANSPAGIGSKRTACGRESSTPATCRCRRGVRSAVPCGSCHCRRA